MLVLGVSGLIFSDFLWVWRYHLSRLYLGGRGSAFPPLKIDQVWAEGKHLPELLRYVTPMHIILYIGFRMRGKSNANDTWCLSQLHAHAHYLRVIQLRFMRKLTIHLSNEPNLIESLLANHVSFNIHAHARTHTHQMADLPRPHFICVVLLHCHHSWAHTNPQWIQVCVYNDVA